MSNKNEISKSFCVLPWIHSFVNNSGNFQVCCTGEEFSNDIKNDEGEIYNIKTNPDVNEVMNSNYMKNLRKILLKGKLPPICTRCVRLERSGSDSRRIIENEEYQEIIEDLIEETQIDGEIKFEAKHIDYRLGNTCNLQCRMCSPIASNKWSDEYLDMTEGLRNGTAFEERIKSYKTLNWQDQDCILEDFKSKYHAVERLHFGGGEPLISKNMISVLEYCVEKGISKNMTLSYNTNLTILPSVVLDLWTKFKEVKILASIDAFNELNGYIRYPSKWNDIDKNLVYLDENYKKFNISEILVSTTVQMNNILHLPALFQYVNKFNFVIKIPNLITLQTPGYLQIFLLPKELKLKALKILRKLHVFAEFSLGENDMYLAANIKHCMNFLNVKMSDDQLEMMQEKFCTYTKRFDQKKSLNYEKVNPEFKILMDKFQS